MLKFNTLHYLFIYFFLFASCEKGKVHSVLDIKKPELEGLFTKILALDNNHFLLVGGIRYEKGFAYIGTLEADTLRLKKLDSLSNQAGFMITNGSVNNLGNIVLCAYGGQIFHYKHSDNLWEKLQLDSYSDLESCTICDDGQIMFAGGVDRRPGFLCRSEDFWWRTTCGEVPSKFFDMVQVGDSTLIVAGEGDLWRSNDRAKTWKKLGMSGDYFKRFSTPNPGLIYVLGSVGSVWSSVDGGFHWKKLRQAPLVQTPTIFMDVHFWNTEIGVIGGLKGQLLKTWDGGNTWEKHSLPRDMDIFSLHMISPEKLLIGSNRGRIIVLDLAN